jgi:hypothetical protein
MITLAVETPIICWAFRRREPRLYRRAALAFFANLATHPAVCFLFPMVIRSALGAFVAAEVWAWSVEAVFYRFVLPSVAWRTSLLFSLIANLASIALGALSYRLTGWP